MRVSMPPIILLLFFFIVAFLSNCSVQERTRKASKSTLEQIKQLFNEKAAHRAFVQNDPRLLADEPHGLGGLRRNPAARRHHNELAVNDPDGDYLQGDMELAEWQAERLRHKLNASPKWRRRKKRKIGREPFYKRWDRRRPISYDMAENVPEKTRQKIRHALAIWQNATCLRFREGGSVDVDRLEFFDGGGCSSFVGRAGGTQGISITTPGCDFVGIIAHEVGHALGTFHEQARPDQPRHIAVHYSNIPVVRWNNFQPIGDDQAATFGLPYDAGSVMHYGPYGFAADHFRPTISTLDTNCSPSDNAKINRAYGCADHCPRKLNCQHGGYTDPNDCEQCVCPTGVSGTLCTEVQPSSCGAAIMVSPTAQNISSPKFPNNFPASSGCVWLLRSPPQGHVLVEFVEEPFGYPCEDTCDKAFVELKTGPDFRVTGYRFCCSTPPSMAFRSVGEEALLIHFGGGQAGHRGFRARVWSDRQWPRTEESVGGRATTTDSEWEKAMVSEVSGEEILSTTTMAPISGPETTVSPVTNSSPVPMPFSSLPPSSTIDLTNSSPVPMPFSSLPPSSTIDLTNSSPVPMPFSPPPPSSTIDLTNSSPVPMPFSPPPPSSTIDCSSCQQWSEWSDCSQMCGGCGRKTRRRLCPPAAPCQTEEKRMCNRMACPGGTNFLFNNGEFHLLWKGCCVGLFLHNATANGDGSPIGQCGPLENSENAFLRIISSLLSSHDASEGNLGMAANATTRQSVGGRRGSKTAGEH